MIQIQNSKYFLSEDNEVINSKNGNILKGTKLRYHGMKIRVNGVKFTTSMHRIMASVYLGLDLRDGNTHVDHIDGNTLNNSLDNLRLCSHLENMNFHSKHQLPHYITKVNDKKYKQGFYYAYRRKINGKTKWLKCSANLDTVLDFKKEYENNH